MTQIKNRDNKPEVSYVSWAGENISKEAVSSMNSAVAEYERLDFSSAGTANFSNILPSTSGRSGLTRRDYDSFRSGEAVPTKTKDIIALAEKVYNKVGLIRNIIDLMADFACQGVRISHPDKRIEVFYRNWFKKVSGKERSERFLNNLYKTANVVIRRQTAKFSLGDRANLFKTMAEVDIKNIGKEKIKKREVPWKYTFLNPSTIEVIGGSLASFSNTKSYAIQLPEHIKRAIKSPSGPEEKKIVAGLPKEIILAASAGNGLYVLDKEKTVAFHYKKDDWQDWAIPMTYPIMDDIILLEKLKLADSAALDGAISNIRIFKLGSLEHKVAPGPGAAVKLKNVLQNSVGAGTIDIVWGPDIELLESKTEVHKFLGPEKYIPTLNNIYGGIGIPPTLTGSFSAGGTTNNFISLKTLVQRLEYGRDILAAFWQGEIEIVQKAMGFAEPASVEFDFSNLGDEQSKNALLIQMSDRSLISDELFQESVKHNVKLENSRISREGKERKEGSRPSKASPFHESQPEVQLNRIALQTMQLGPDQIGMDFEGTPKESEKFGAAPPGKTAKKGIPQQGRPKNSADKTKRKTKKFVPTTKASEEYQVASLNIWALDAQEKIAEVVNPGILHHFNKKNMRSLGAEEQKIAEKIKLGVLFSIEPYSSLSKEDIIEKASGGTQMPANVVNKINDTLDNVSVALNRKLTLAESHRIYSEIYSEDNYED